MKHILFKFRKLTFTSAISGQKVTFYFNNRKYFVIGMLRNIHTYMYMCTIKTWVSCLHQSKLSYHDNFPSVISFLNWQVLFYQTSMNCTKIHFSGSCLLAFLVCKPSLHFWILVCDVPTNNFLQLTFNTIKDKIKELEVTYFEHQELRLVEEFGSFLTFASNLVSSSKQSTLYENCWILRESYSKTGHPPHLLIFHYR